LTVSAGAANSLIFTTEPGNTTAGQSISPSPVVQLQDQFGNNAPQSTPQITLTLHNGTLSSGSSSQNPNAGGAATFSGLQINQVGAGLYFTAAGSGLSGAASSTFNITVGAAAQVRVETAPDGSGTVVPAGTVTAGNSIAVYAVARDAEGNFIANAAASAWSLANVTGGVLGGDLAPAGDSKSATFTAHKVGTATLHATSGSLATTDSGVQTVVAGAATQTRVETAANGSGSVVSAQNVTAGNSVTLYAIARDAQGNFVANPAAAWSLVNLTGGAAGGDLAAGGASAVLTGHLVGSAQVQAVANGFTGQSGVQTVVAGAAAQTRVETASDDSGTVVPAQNVTAGISLTVYAIARDAQGNFVGNPPATWSVVSLSGGVVGGDLAAGGASALFTGHHVGSGRIQAVANGFTGQSGLQTVVPGAVSAGNSTLSASPGSVSTDGGATSTLTVTAKDANNNVIPGIAAASVVLAATGTGNTLVQPSAATDTNGQTTATLASTKAESKTVSVTISGTPITQTAAVTFTAGSVSAGNSTISASPGSVMADGVATATVTVTARDAHNKRDSGVDAGQRGIGGDGERQHAGPAGCGDGCQRADDWNPGFHPCRGQDGVGDPWRDAYHANGFGKLYGGGFGPLCDGSDRESADGGDGV
jgi:adhesin/invasin